MNLPHETTCPVEVGKWSLPAHTGVIAQISNVLYDDEASTYLRFFPFPDDCLIVVSVFPSPLTFDPSRFIDDNGKLKKVEELIPFSIGKRQCLGEALARMELFLFTANLLNRFELSCVRAGESPSMKKSFGTTAQPHPYRYDWAIIVHKRMALSVFLMTSLITLLVNMASYMAAEMMTYALQKQVSDSKVKNS
ncbi:hypothetical protein KIN20_019656 [Parelaphostrongylus tenuis]|uniref:Cytochrome P450 n=1 Tax=Parelaphostrongylus tenuis TaxID=148309 RepID=A0AAD5N533_PARTN|nr:hypothetical protein KIN20_019656 [Parelaphostrongylus tenuis]